ncbi:TetR-like C-terminal domain-containing protein [Microbacterium sp. NPDC087868]|uniref:TetR-like C-terminal domain-containing protein n=1 Tax=Microbacterium sp. NPDC087868 TaxID=3364195 RepID=UPI00384A5146
MAREKTRRKVHDAVLSLAAGSRVSTITMEGIAGRAGVSKQTLYRSWSSTGAILFDALLARSTDAAGRVAVPDSGDIRDDLLLLATGMIAELTDPAQEGLLRRVTAELQADEDLALEYRETLLEPQLGAIAHRLDRAGVPAPDDVAELFVGAIFHRWLLRSRPFDPEWVENHVDRALTLAGSVS